MNVVVITHAHPDHLGGLVVDGEPVFATARHVILGAEWEFWTSPSTKAPESLAVESRRALLARAVEQQLHVAAHHLGRHGYVQRDGGAFRLVEGRP